MNKEEIEFLMSNGFTLTEIMTMQKKPSDPKPEEPKPEEPEKESENVSGTRSDNEKPEEKPNETAELKKEIAELKQLIQKQNIRNAQQPYAEPERTIEDIFNELINPKRKGEDEK